MNKILELVMLTLFCLIIIIIFLFNNNIYLIEVGILCIYLYGWITFFYYKEKAIGFIIFWISILFFNLTKIFFELFGIEKWEKTLWWIDHRYSTDAKEYTLIIIFLTLYSVLLGKFFTNKTNKIKNKKYNIKISKLSWNINFIIFLYSIGIFLLKTMNELKIIYKFGYVSIYTGILNKVKYPVWYKGNSILIKVSFYTLIISKMKKKYFLFYSSIYLGVYFLSALKGQRLFFISELLFIIYLYIKIYSIKINFRFYLKYGVIILLILFFIFFIEAYRGNNSITNLKIIERLNSYSSNLDIITLYLDFQDKGLKKFNYFFAPVIDGVNNILHYSVFKSGYTEVYLKYRHELQIQLSAFLNKSLYLKGYGLGGNYLADIYSTFGIIGIFMVNFIIGYFLFQDYIFFNNKYLIILYMYFFKKLIYAPRGSLLFLPHEVVMIWGYLFILSFMKRRIKNVKIVDKESLPK